MDTKITNIEMYGKLPPQDIEVEMAVLGALMLERDAINKIDLSPEIFYKEDHRIIYKTIQDLNNNGKNIDLLTITVDLKNNNLLAEVGGPVYITQLTQRVSSAAHIEQYARVLIENYIRRELITLSTSMMNMSYDTTNEIDDIFNTYESTVSRVDKILIGKNTGRFLSDVLKDLINEVDRRSKLSSIGGLTGINTGFGVLNKYTSGWQNGWVVVFAARPAQGKTAIAVNKFAKAAAMSGKYVNIFSLEMDDLSLAERLVIGASGINSYDFKSGRLSDSDWMKFNKALGELESLPIYIDDSPYVKLSHIRNVARSNKRKGKCDLIIIDYLQLADAGTDKNRNREQEVSEMSRRLKSLAKEINVPIIVLSQLSRAVEGRADKRPILSDLRESGAIEQDADMVIFPFRPAYYQNTDEFGSMDTKENEGILIIAKNRHGVIGDIKFYHNETMTDFSDEPFNSQRYDMF